MLAGGHLSCSTGALSTTSPLAVVSRTPDHLDVFYLAGQVSQDAEGFQHNDYVVGDFRP
jgi:hypothetical protein